MNWSKPEKNPAPCLLPLWHMGGKIKCHCWSALQKSNRRGLSRGGKVGPMEVDREKEEAKLRAKGRHF